ncbi:MAG: nucleotide sugar dehydrogenase [Betaproteobacteria bacterium]
MNIAVVGLGPVGIVAAAGLALAGHRVHATDRDPARVAALREGRTPIVEPGLPARVAATVASGALVAVGSVAEAVIRASITLICVGTPASASGEPDLAALVSACDAIGAALRRATPSPVVVVRSTVLPGTTRDLVVPRLAAASGLVPGRDFHVAVQPEFLREGSALADYDLPAKLVVGSLDAQVADAIVALLAPDPACVVVRTSPEAAELAKVADNAWHALKVAFANEIGALARELQVDGDALMTDFARDRTLNVSAAYLRPGAPFGGSCLVKDVAALDRRADAAGFRAPLLAAILPSNRAHFDRVVDDIAADARIVGIVGLSFKPGTADLRASPYLEIAHALAARGRAVFAWDERVPRDDPACDPAWFAASPQALADAADTIVVCHASPEALAAIASRATSRHTVVDLTGVERHRFSHTRYRSVAWRPERNAP